MLTLSYQESLSLNHMFDCVLSFVFLQMMIDLGDNDDNNEDNVNGNNDDNDTMMMMLMM